MGGVSGEGDGAERPTLLPTLHVNPFSEGTLDLKDPTSVDVRF